MFTLEHIISTIGIFTLGFVVGMTVNQLCKDLSADYPVIDDHPDETDEDRRHERDCQ